MDLSSSDVIIFPDSGRVTDRRVNELVDEFRQIQWPYPLPEPFSSSDSDSSDSDGSESDGIQPWTIRWPASSVHRLNLRWAGHNRPDHPNKQTIEHNMPSKLDKTVKFKAKLVKKQLVKKLVKTKTKLPTINEHPRRRPDKRRAV